MPFRSTFDCLWCGSAHTCRASDDIEGWASLCSACIGRAGQNGFLRFRLHRALTERATAPAGAGPARAAPAGAAPATGAAPDALDDGEATAEVPTAGTAATRGAAPDTVGEEMLAYYEARAPEYDDWYLRRGRYSHGPEDDAAWAAELGAARRWLDGLPLSGSIVELAAGTGWWSTTLARKGSSRLIDGTAAPLAIAGDRLAREGLAAEWSVRDAWDEPDAEVDALFAGFWLSHVPDARLDAFLGLARRWLRPGGTIAVIDSLPDAASGARDHPAPGAGVAIRRLADGREFRIVKEFRSPEVYAAALERAGFVAVETGATGRFFVLGRGTAAPS